MRGILRRPDWQRKAACFATALATLVILGPFGTYTDMGAGERLVFWTTVLAGVGLFIHIGVTVALDLKVLRGWRRWTRIVAGAAVGAVPGSAAVAFAERVMRPPGMSLDPGQLVSLWWQVALISVAIALVEFRRPPETAPRHGGAAEAPRADAVTGPARTPLHDRLPPTDGAPAEIVSLTVQDHYVEVTTVHDRHLVLMRFADALEEVEALDGVRIHRSHWVARPHVRDLRRAGHRAWVELSDGRELSVSKTYLPDLRSALDAPRAAS